MIKGLIDLHSTIRYASLILLVISLIIGLYGLSSNRKYTRNIRRWHLWTIILLNVQLITGLILYFTKGYFAVWANMSTVEGMFRFFGFEHFLGMLIAISLVNMGYHLSVKKPTDRARFRGITLFYGIGFVLIFMFIPWPFLHSWATWF
ncbi:MAG TPA: hypothetical protein VE870_17405 [Bacteroidales bacterium]|nr:hypothetical protein [Bacteroidales bacterium]